MIVKKVNAKKPYNVVIAEDFSNLRESILSATSFNKVCIVADENTSMYLEQVKNALNGFEILTYVIKAGEQSKCLKTFGEIASFLAQNQMTRKDLLIALGGGVVGDLTAFVASCYMRGIAFVNLPTSLLAMVDSSVGGKTAIDIPEGKNLLGSFYSPNLCYINVNTLKTLPNEEILCGLGEIVKYAYLSNTITANDIKEFDYVNLISKSLDVKISIVEEDEFEGGKRKLLNLGHTIGHGIESLSNYTLSHGLCVAKGIDYIIDFSKDYYNLSEEKYSQLKDILRAQPFDLSLIYPMEQIAEKIKVDKKAQSSYVDMVLIKDVGKCEIVKIAIKDIK